MNQIIFDFLCQYLTKLNISFVISEHKSLRMKDIDLGLRNSILKKNIVETVSSLDDFRADTLYHFSDYYSCNYSFFQLEDGRLIFIGPYLYQDMNKDDIRQLIIASEIPDSLISQLQDYYYGLPIIKDNASFMALLRHAYSKIANVSDLNERTFDLKTLESREEFLKKHTFVVPEDPILSMNLLEKRYHFEDELLNAVSTGNASAAISIIEKIGISRISSRTNNAFRDRKALTLSLNTLLRRTAYTAGVHPFYIDSISSNYARFIEHTNTFQELEDLVPYLIRSYCDLVKKRSTALYSAPVRQILVTIDASLTSDLSLKRFANELFLNTSYLSSLFKKETGMTLTDYVNKQRISHAKRLLKSTTLSIQAISTNVGITDLHYFTRLFRRETGYSPREFRKL